MGAQHIRSSFGSSHNRFCAVVVRSVGCVRTLAHLPYIEFWNLKMKCTQYELYGQATLKNARTILIFVAERSGQGAWASFRAAKEGVPGVGPRLGRCELGGGRQPRIYYAVAANGVVRLIAGSCLFAVSTSVEACDVDVLRWHANDGGWVDSIHWWWGCKGGRGGGLGGPGADFVCNLRCL